MMDNISMARTRSVLVVDDELDTAEMLAEMLRLSGYRLFKASSGRQAVQVVTRERPDVVLLDLMMPDMSGLDVLRYMRRDPYLQKIPVIILSARCMLTDVQSGLQAGADLFLTKPLDCEDLCSAVEEVINTSRMEPDAGLP